MNTHFGSICAIMISQTGVSGKMGGSKVKRIVKLLAAVLCAALLMSCAAASAETAEAEQKSMKQRLLDSIAENQLKYAPKVQTLENSVQVQRTPQDSGIYNIRRLDDDNRGCYACHTDLQDTIFNMPDSQWAYGLSGSHLETSYDGGVKMTAENCLTCHNNGELAVYIHGIHTNSNKAFSAMGGDCMSCHYVMPDGTMAMWDLVKYDVLRGINSADASTGEFSYDYTTLSTEPMFSMNWMSYSMFTDEMSFERYDDALNDVPADPELFDEWEISVTGAVNNPVTYTLPELIEMLPSKTLIMAYECAENEGSGALIRNVEVTGLSVKDIIALAEPMENAVGVSGYDRGAMYRYHLSAGFDWLEDHESLIVYEMNGERLRTKDGYPAAIWTEGMHAGKFVKHVASLVVEDNPENIILDFSSSSDHYAPTQSIFFTQEGQIIDAYEPYTFEGYTFGRDQEIVAVEFSLDRGKTWARFDVDGGEIGRWTYWHYTFTPEQEGAYVLYVRGVAANGAVSEEPAKMLVNAK